MDVEELFLFYKSMFYKSMGGWTLDRYYKRDDPNITEIEIPEEYNGLPVVAVGPRAFSSSKHIASVVLPKSIRAVEAYAFQYCEELNSVTFNSSPILERDVFTDCHKLPADITLMGLVNSCDISEPFIE